MISEWNAWMSYACCTKSRRLKKLHACGGVGCDGPAWKKDFCPRLLVGISIYLQLL